MPTLTIPNTFSPATTILSADVNADLAAIATFVNSTKLDQDNIQTGGVSTANLANLAVTAAKLASDAVSTVKILDLNVTTGKINDLAVTTGKINDLAVTTGKLATGAVTGTQVSSNINLPGSVVQAGGKNVICSQTNSNTNGLGVIRGHFNSGGATDLGEGFTTSRLGTGAYQIDFAVPFSAVPTVVATADTLGFLRIHGITTSVCFIDTQNQSFAAEDIACGLIAIGIR